MTALKQTKEGALRWNAKTKEEKTEALQLLPTWSSLLARKLPLGPLERTGKNRWKKTMHFKNDYKDKHEGNK